MSQSTLLNKNFAIENGKLDTPVLYVSKVDFECKEVFEDIEKWIEYIKSKRNSQETSHTFCTDGFFA